MHLQLVLRTWFLEAGVRLEVILRFYLTVPSKRQPTNGNEEKFHSIINTLILYVMVLFSPVMPRRNHIPMEEGIKLDY